jgi:misacylated tRNA(Ala) deacylase
MSIATARHAWTGKGRVAKIAPLSPPQRGPMTEELFRDDAYLKRCAAIVVAADAAGIRLDRTVFYPMGGGQPGDVGTLRRADGSNVAVTDTRKGAAPGEILHLVAPDTALPEVGERVVAEIDWTRRHRHMRMHTSLHLLCAVVPYGVTGGQIGELRSRLDFDIGDGTLDKDAIAQKLNARWITDEELAAQPDLVRTMSVKPPSGAGRVRLIDIAGIDLQPCGGTHVAQVGEIGPVVIEKIESKGKRNRRVVVVLAAP